MWKRTLHFQSLRIALIRGSCPLAVKAKDSGSVRSAQGDEEASVLGYSMAIYDGVISCSGAEHYCKSDVIDWHLIMESGRTQQDMDQLRTQKALWQHSGTGRSGFECKVECLCIFDAAISIRHETASPMCICVFDAAAAPISANTHQTVFDSEIQTNSVPSSLVDLIPRYSMY
jgi:hypothetical protein